MRGGAKRLSKGEVQRILTDVFLDHALPELVQQANEDPIAPSAHATKPLLAKQVLANPLLEKPIPGYQLARMFRRDLAELEK